MASDGVPRERSVIPNAGLPVLVAGRTEYPLQPEPFVDALLKYIDKDGVGIVGGCCETTPEHIRQLAVAVEDLRAKSQIANGKSQIEIPKAGVTSLYSGF